MISSCLLYTSQNLTDEGGDPTGPLVLRGQALTVTGYRDLAADGSVSYYLSLIHISAMSPSALWQPPTMLRRRARLCS